MSFIGESCQRMHGFGKPFHFNGNLSTDMLRIECVSFVHMSLPLDDFSPKTKEFSIRKKNPELRRSGRCMWHSVWHTPCRTLRATSRTPHLAALMLNFTHTHTHTQIDETVRHWLYFLVLCISSEVLDCQIVSISYTISSLTWWNITRHIDKLSINWRRASSYIRSKNPVLLFALDVFWDIKPKYAVCDSHICSCVSLNVEQNKRDSVTTLSDDIDDSK